MTAFGAYDKFWYRDHCYTCESWLVADGVHQLVTLEAQMEV